jgi:hypothetical protein
MPKFCLIKEVADDFCNKLKDGTINPEKMLEMTSDERQKFLSGIVGKEHGKAANALFESKMILKNQKQGMITWAKTISGIDKKVKDDIVAKIEKLNKVLEPGQDELFLRDLAEQKMGMGITEEEAKTISILSKKTVELRDMITKDIPAGDRKRLDYGAARVKLTEYVDSLKHKSTQMRFRDYMNTKGLWRGISDLSGLAKAMKASLDNSAVFRQGWKTMFTDTAIWGKNAMRSFGDLANSFKGKDVIGAVKAEVYSRENAMNGFYDRMKLEVGMNEETYPTSLPEKLPVLGRLFKASESAYKGFLLRVRADIADKTLIMAEKAGVNLEDDFEMRGIGKLINSITGRGDLGSLEKIGKEVNNVFFSPKLLKSHIDTLTAHTIKGIGEESISKFARKRAAVNLAKIVAGTTVMLGIASAIDPDSVDWDPRSSNFGKIKVGNTRFDVSGGMSSIVTLASRILPTKDENGYWGQFSKSSSSGKLSKINSGEFGSMTALDVVVNFGSNKLSPMSRLVLDLIQQKDFNDQPITIGGEIKSLLLPLPINTYSELKKDPNSANLLLAIIADGMGISTNTYGSMKPKLQGMLGTKKVDPAVSAEVDRLAKVGYAPAIGSIESSNYVKELKLQIPADKYNQFLDEFGPSYEAKLSQRIQSPFYKNLTAEKKKDLLDNDKAAVLQILLRKYGYKRSLKVVDPTK